MDDNGTEERKVTKYLIKEVGGVSEGLPRLDLFLIGAVRPKKVTVPVEVPVPKIEKQNVDVKGEIEKRAASTINPPHEPTLSVAPEPSPVPKQTVDKVNEWLDGNTRNAEEKETPKIQTRPVTTVSSANQRKEEKLINMEDLIDGDKLVLQFSPNYKMLHRVPPYLIPEKPEDSKLLESYDKMLRDFDNVLYILDKDLLPDIECRDHLWKSFVKRWGWLNRSIRMNPDEYTVCTSFSFQNETSPTWDS